MLEGANANVEFDASERLPDEGVIRGRDAYRRFFERTFDTWEPTGSRSSPMTATPCGPPA